MRSEKKEKGTGKRKRERVKGEGREKKGEKRGVLNSQFCLVCFKIEVDS